MSHQSPRQENRDREAEHRFGTLAIAEARKSPKSPRVGAVLVAKDGQIVTGYRDEFNGLHAEQAALRKASAEGVDPQGSTVFTTLEPCANSRTSRVSCATLLADAGVTVVHIGEYDPNPQVHRLGWKLLRDRKVVLRDFPADLREQSHKVAHNFTQLFTHGVGLRGGAKFDFTQRGGEFTIKLDEAPDAPAWETRWGSCSARAIYLNGGRPGFVALARHATAFEEIDDPGALDFENHFAKIELGGIGVMRGPHGYALCLVEDIEPTADHGGNNHVSVKIKWEIRLTE